MGIAIPNISIPDLFRGDAFSAVTLTAHVTSTPYTPNTLGAFGDRLYMARGISTTTAAVGMMDGKLDIIEASPRGAPVESVQDHPKRKILPVPSVRLAKQDHVNAGEVQNALAMSALTGQPQLETLSGLIKERLEGPFGLRQQIELTHEYHRLGGVKGVVLDKDGSELFNWYQVFGLTPPAPIQTNFGALTADGGAFEVKCTEMVRGMTVALEGLPVFGMVPVALCGDNYFDKLYSNKEVKADRRNRDQGRGAADVFGETKAFKSIEFGGIIWANYRGTSDGKVGIHTDEARLFPLGVPGLFQHIFTPPDLVGWATITGLPIYAYMPPEEQTIRRATVEVQSDPIPLCLRPNALFRLTHETTPA